MKIGFFAAIIFFGTASVLCTNPAKAVGFGVRSGLDYQNRAFDSGGMEYDLNYWGLFIEPMVNITSRWSVFARIGYSRLVFDRPEFGASDYDEWGMEWGGGTSLTLFKWGGLYGVVEGAFSRTSSDRHLDDGGKEEGTYLTWGADGRLGWDLKIINPYLGFAYTDGRIDHDYSSGEENFSEHYRLKDRWLTFVGGSVNIPPFTNLRGRYYFGDDTLAVLSLGMEF